MKKIQVRPSKDASESTTRPRPLKSGLETRTGPEHCDTGAPASDESDEEDPYLARVVFARSGLETGCG